MDCRIEPSPQLRGKCGIYGRCRAVIEKPALQFRAARHLLAPAEMLLASFENLAKQPMEALFEGKRRLRRFGSFSFCFDSLGRRIRLWIASGNSTSSHSIASLKEISSQPLRALAQLRADCVRRGAGESSKLNSHPKMVLVRRGDHQGHSP